MEWKNYVVINNCSVSNPLHDKMALYKSIVHNWRYFREATVYFKWQYKMEIYFFKM